MKPLREFKAEEFIKKLDEIVNEFDELLANKKKSHLNQLLRDFNKETMRLLKEGR
jgi:hypothetical protein